MFFSLERKPAQHKPHQNLTITYRNMFSIYDKVSLNKKFSLAWLHINASM